jgi:hypothetical protein
MPAKKKSQIEDDMRREPVDLRGKHEFDHTGTGNVKADWTHEAGSVVYYRRTQQIQTPGGTPIGQFLGIPDVQGPDCWMNKYKGEYGWRWLNTPWPDAFCLVVMAHFTVALNKPEQWFDEKPLVGPALHTVPATAARWKVWSTTDNQFLGYMWLEGNPVTHQGWLVASPHIQNGRFLKNELTFVKTTGVIAPFAGWYGRNAVVAHPTAPADRVCTNV